MRLSAFAVIVAAALVAPFVVAAGPAGASPTSAQAEHLLASSISAANSQGAVTWTDVQTNAQQSVLEIGQAGRSDGTEVVAEQSDGLSLHMVLALVGPKIYVLANPPALEQLMGLRPAAARREAGNWFWVPSSDRYLYAILAAGLTVPTAIGAVDLVGVLSLISGGRVLGQDVTALRQVQPQGLVTSVSTVYVKAKGVPLPVEAVEGSAGQDNVDVFSFWGQQPVVAVPSGAVPFDQGWLLKPLPSF